MAGRGRGRGRGRGTPLFISKDMKELLSTQGVGRADEIPPPLYDVSDTILHFIYKTHMMLTKILKNVTIDTSLTQPTQFYSSKYSTDITERVMVSFRVWIRQNRCL